MTLLAALATAVRRRTSAALDLLLGTRCAGCGAPGTVLCADCTAALVSTPVAAGVAGIPVCGVGAYEGLVRRLALAHKERGVHALARHLGRAAGARVSARFRLPTRGRRVLVVPVPSAAAAVRRRGYDHTAALARHCAAELCDRGVDAHVHHGLVRRRRVADQADLHRDERARNQVGTMAWRHPRRRLASDRSATLVVVVDDIMTTGATLREAARVVEAGGWWLEGFGVVAVTPSPGQRRLVRHP